MSTLVNTLVNGVTQTHVPIADRGLQYGDGLFETLAVRDGVINQLALHLERLRHGCGVLGLGFEQWNALNEELCQLAQDQHRAVLKIIITRGSGGRGYRPPAAPQCTRIVARYAWPDYPPEWQQQGIQLRVCQTRLGANPALAGIKHLNRLEQVMARAEWEDPAIAEGLMLDSNHHVISGTMSNLFYVQQGELLTPALETAGVAGITRRRICETIAPALSLTCRTVKSVTLDTLQQADELFVCNTLAGIWPVRELLLPKGQSARYQNWPLTQKLLEAL